MRRLTLRFSRRAPIRCLIASATIGAGLSALAAPVVASEVDAADAKVSVGSPTGGTPQNHQSEPAVAMDAHNPDVLVAGANDKIDQQLCPQSLSFDSAKCEGDTGVGISGVYFSFDRGRTWVQPEYTGLTQRDCGSESPCAPHVGSIGRVPWYNESGLVDAGDPALAIGPRPVNGKFSWSNGSRVYYGNNTAPLSDFFGPTGTSRPFAGYQGIAVSRFDNPTPTRVMDKSNWLPPVVVDSRQATTTFNDKVQVWADNAESSAYFGRVYECHTDYRSNGSGAGYPAAPMVSVSKDAGDTWTTSQAGPAKVQGAGGTSPERVGCTIRTDSKGVVYLFDGTSPDAGVLPLTGQITLQKSFNGGMSWTRPRVIQSTRAGYFRDPLSSRTVIDGNTGARTSIATAPSVDIANGAPSGIDATDRIVLTWSDAGSDINDTHTLVTTSVDGGAAWGEPARVSRPGDRPLYSAAAISPSGDRVYIVYEAVTSPWRGSDVASPRPYHGVFLSAPITGSSLGTWSTEFVGPSGDLRGTFPGHRLREERIGDYVYAAASRDYGVGLWIDARNAAVCPAIQQWRGDSLAAGKELLPAPWPLADCPAAFGNTDVYAATTG